MTRQRDYAAAPLYTVDIDAHGTVNSDTMLMLSAGSSPSHNWEMMKSEISASLSDEGNNLASNLCTLQKAIETRVWATYGVTSTWRRLALSETANKNIRTIISVSNQAMNEDEHSRVYMAILKALAKAYHDWKLSRNNTSEPWKDGHSEKSVSPVPEAKQENHAPRNQEGISQPTQTQDSVMRDPIGTANALDLPSRNDISKLPLPRDDIPRPLEASNKQLKGPGSPSHPSTHVQLDAR